MSRPYEWVILSVPMPCWASLRAFGEKIRFYLLGIRAISILDIHQKCVRIMATILGHGATAAQRTLNPLIQVRILVPRPA